MITPLLRPPRHALPPPVSSIASVEDLTSNFTSKLRPSRTYYYTHSRVAQRHPSYLHRRRMANFWAEACTAQDSRPLWQLQQANYGGCLFAVSAMLAVDNRDAAKCVCAPAECARVLRADAGGRLCCSRCRLRTAGWGFYVGRMTLSRTGCGCS